MMTLTTAEVKNARLSEPGIYCVHDRVISFAGISSVHVRKSKPKRFHCFLYSYVRSLKPPAYQIAN